MLLLLAAVLFLSPSLVSSAGEYFSTNGNQIVNIFGEPVRIAGINWFGFETVELVPHGLLVRNYQSVLNQTKSLGFNTLRIPYTNDMLRSTSTDLTIDYDLNPDLQGLTPIEVLDKFVAYCAKVDLRIFLDRHSCKAGNFINEDLWYIPGDSRCTEQAWIDDWVALAARYLGSPTVIGADLFNEPKRDAPTWGVSSPETDWNKAAERCGNAIHGAHPEWLIIVEGITKYSYHDGAGRLMSSYSFWGANLVGAVREPVVLRATNKLVYSIHDYPESVSVQDWFSTPDYPNDLYQTWSMFWGYLFENNIAPIIIGEMGTHLETATDKQWLDKLTDYIDGDLRLRGTNDLAEGKKGISWTFWCLNPDSHDTGGILEEDWTTVRHDKMEYLQSSLDPDSTTLRILSASPSMAPTGLPTTSAPTALPQLLSASLLLVNVSVPVFDEAHSEALSITVSRGLDLPADSVVVFSSQQKRRKLAELFVVVCELRIYVPVVYTTIVEPNIVDESWSSIDYAYARLTTFVFSGEGTKLFKENLEIFGSVFDDDIKIVAVTKEGEGDTDGNDSDGVGDFGSFKDFFLRISQRNPPPLIVGVIVAVSIVGALLLTVGCCCFRKWYKAKRLHEPTTGDDFVLNSAGVVLEEKKAKSPRKVGSPRSRGSSPRSSKSPRGRSPRGGVATEHLSY